MIATNLVKADGSVENGEAAFQRRDSACLKTLGEMFDEVVKRCWDSVAVTCMGRELTYRQLQQQAEVLAVELQAAGVRAESLVGIFMQRSELAIVAILAVVKAGGAYLPLDPAYPAERISTILEDAWPSVILTEESLRGKLPAHGAMELVVDRMNLAEAGREEKRFETRVEPDNLAYVIYTSGSTGKPKGVMVTHGNVVRLFLETQHWFRFDQADVWTLFHSLAFDFSVWEMWGSLLYGGRLVVVPFAVSRSPQEFYSLLLKERVTVLNQTPSAFYQLIKIDQDRRDAELALRVVVFGGEALNFKMLQPWFAAHGDQRPRLINMYGITETTVHVTYRELTTADAEDGVGSLIGVPIPDLSIQLLGEDKRPVSVGDVGEIYVGGAGVARGYLNRPQLTAERFLPNPVTADPADRLYRSGDLGRYLPSGELEYLGRADSQVKINGFRVEIGEIEAAITAFDRVAETRVIAHTDDAGTKRLVAYYIPKAGEVIATREISEFLSAKIPYWMMPSLYIPISKIPLTEHGKVDYAALPAPTFGSATDSGDRHGSNAEVEVAKAWRKVLGADHVGLDDNFFDIGGTSMLLMSVHAALEAQFHRKISVADLFAYTTVRSLAKLLEGTKSDQGWWNAVQSQAQKQRAAFAGARIPKKVG